MGIKDFFLGANRGNKLAKFESAPGDLPNDFNLDVSAQIVASWHAAGELDEGAATAAELMAENSKKQAVFANRVRAATETVAANEVKITQDYLVAKTAVENSQHQQHHARLKSARQSALLQQTSQRVLAAVSSIGEGLRE